MAALQYVDQPNYSAILFRRTYTDLALPGALMDRAHQWLGGTDAERRDEGKTWVFPSGAKLTFAYMQHAGDWFRYKSAEFQFVGFDELTAFPEEPYRFMFSRLRRLVNCDIPIRMRSASNPGDRGHVWVKERFLSPRSKGVFVPAKLDDNPHVDREEYTATLAELDPVTRAQMLAGDWDAHGGGRFLLPWFNARYRRQGTHYVLPGERVFEWPKVRRFLTCDPAASAENTSKKGSDPDYTVICAWGITPDLQLLWLDCCRFRAELPDIIPKLLEVWDRWEPEYAAIESVAANSGVYQLARRTRCVCKAIGPQGKDKLVVATRAINLAANGRILLPVRFPYPDSAQIEDALAELVLFTGDETKDAHDDVVSCVSYAAILMTGAEDQKRAAFVPYAAGGY